MSMEDSTQRGNKEGAPAVGTHILYVYYLNAGLWRDEITYSKEQSRLPQPRFTHLPPAARPSS